MLMACWVALGRCEVLVALEGAGYFSYTIAFSSSGNGCPFFCARGGGGGGVCLSFPSGLGGQMVTSRTVVGGLEPRVPGNLAASCCLTLVRCTMDKLALVVILYRLPQIGHGFAQWRRFHAHPSFAVTAVGRVTLVPRTVEEALLAEPCVRAD